MTKTKAAAWLVLLLMTLGFLLSGCGKDSTDLRQAIQDAANSTASSEASPKSAVELEVENRVRSHAANAGVTENISGITIQFTEADYQAVRAAIDGIESFYPFTSISNVEKAFEMYKEVPLVDNRRELALLSGSITANSLFEMVKRNNDNYKESKGFAAVMLKYFEDDYVMWVCEIVADTINRELQRFNYPIETLYEFEQSLQNLCIFESAHGANLGYISDEGVMALSPVWMDAIPTLYDNMFAREQVITHEVLHLFQRIGEETRAQTGGNKAFGYCRDFADALEVNSLYYNWHIESSAEWLAASLYEGKPVTYLTPIGYLETLMFVTLFKDDERLETPARLTFQRDINRVFEYFNCDTYDRQIELLNMMYAIEVIQFEPEDFIGIYTQQVLEREMDEEALIDMKIRLRSGAITTISKYFYENLSKKLTQSEITLDELFLTIALYEAKLANHSRYSEEWRYPLYEHFFQDYMLIQDVFFEKISNITGVGADELYEYYDTYNATIDFPNRGRFFNTDVEYDDIEFSWLSTEKNEFMTKIFGNVDIIQNKTLSIRQMFDIFSVLI